MSTFEQKASPASKGTASAFPPMSWRGYVQSPVAARFLSPDCWAGNAEPLSRQRHPGKGQLTIIEGPHDRARYKNNVPLVLSPLMPSLRSLSMTKMRRVHAQSPSSHCYANHRIVRLCRTARIDQLHVSAIRWVSAVHHDRATRVQLLKDTGSSQRKSMILSVVSGGRSTNIAAGTADNACRGLRALRPRTGLLRRDPQLIVSEGAHADIHEEQRAHNRL